MKAFSLSAVLLLLAACQATPVVDRQAEARALLETDRAFADLSVRSGARAAFGEYMAPDGMMMPRASEGAVEGYDQVMALFGEADAPGYQLLWEPRFAEVAAAGDMGWTWGTYSAMLNDAEVSSGKYVNIWKKQPDGRWKVRMDVGNQNPRDEPAQP